MTLLTVDIFGESIGVPVKAYSMEERKELFEIRLAMQVTSAVYGCDVFMERPVRCREGPEAQWRIRRR